MAQHDIKINLPGLLKMLGSNIYAEPDVAVREMIQNAHDTCIIRGTKDKKFTDPRIANNTTSYFAEGTPAEEDCLFEENEFAEGKSLEQEE